MIINGKRYKGLQAYKEKGKDSFLYVYTDSMWTNNGRLMIPAAVAVNEGLPTCHSDVSAEWLQENCTEKSFRKLPEYVQQHLTNYVKDMQDEHSRDQGCGRRR